ncbi:putative late blight resistance protein homolog R1A-3 [Nicotiana tabacum]|uniref:Late blight resistance protein homolog R1A-10 n=2 Tax=Nicotiana TaxID=4085 RepID=A0A1S3YL46_TOBAC|nr:PREDICTED: putative late blight resistance protein homolog R1A-10 [Nicotiana tabacum]
MAATVVSSLVEKLQLLINEEVKLITGAVKEEFQRLLEQVERLQDSVGGIISKKESDSKRLKNLEKVIRSIVYEIEDEIDEFLLQAKLQQEKNLFGIKCLDFDRGDRVQDLSSKIDSILDRINRFIHGKNHPDAKRVLIEDMRREARDVLPRKDGPSVEPQDAWLENNEVVRNNEVVGLDEEANIVIHRLVEGTNELDVIPIVGMFGLGKTTLAMKVYHDSRILYEFFFVIWIYVGQSYNLKDIFLKILRCFMRRLEDYHDKDVNELAQIIHDFVAKGGRCLIVLDDVWDSQVVNSLVSVFPKNNKGHRIMMTTRDLSVAKCCSQNPHDMKFLSDYESFELLNGIIFGEERCPVELEGFVKSIARKCSGVPLAILTIAGTLLRCTKVSDWQRVEKKVEQHLMDRGDPSSCLKFVNTSYTLLSEEMQACFLYFGVFPQAFSIPAWKLIRLWLAEGLIKPNGSQALEETAKIYLNNLVNRNLVTALQKSCDGNVKTCCVQGMLHQFCKEEASSKWLFQEVRPTPDQAILTIQDPVASRRLCIQSSALNDFLSAEPLAEHVRSFYCFSSEKRQIELSGNDIQLIPKAFPLIRVLDIQSFNFVFSKDDFNRLFHLRYIAISADIKSLPKSFGKFWNLQTLILNTSTSKSTLDIKANIWNMLRLRHLHTNIPAKLPSPPHNPKGKASCLQTLSVVSPESCTKDILAKACNLKKLKIQGRMIDFLGTSKGGWCNLEELKCLEHLKMLNDIHSWGKTLHIPPSFFKFLRTLKKLTLSNTRFDWSEAERLGQLECLEVLKLKENAFAGESWRPERGGFSQLQVLWIQRAELEIWEASELHFPRLRHLVLICCERLQAVPCELAGVPSLQEMNLEHTRRAVKSAREIERKKMDSTKFKLTIFPPEAE